MSIRTLEMLQDALDRDFAWRLKEISQFRSEARTAAGSWQEALIRAGIAMLYAHWEGFVKSGADAYVTYVNARKLTHDDLELCFVALSLKTRIHEMQTVKKARPTIAALKGILHGQNHPARLGGGKVIKKRENVNSEVLMDIGCWVGLDVSRYETRKQLIDERLLKRRNAIAHGREGARKMDVGGFEELVDRVLEVMRWFKEDIEAVANAGGYRRATKSVRRLG